MAKTTSQEHDRLGREPHARLVGFLERRESFVLHPDHEALNEAIHDVVVWSRHERHRRQRGCLSGEHFFVLNAALVLVPANLEDFRLGPVRQHDPVSTVPRHDVAEDDRGR